MFQRLVALGLVRIVDIRAQASSDTLPFLLQAEGRSMLLLDRFALLSRDGAAAARSPNSWQLPARSTPNRWERDRSF